MRKSGWASATLALVATGFMSAGNGSSAASWSSTTQNEMVVVMGTDYPTLANVVSFQVPISGISLSGNGGTNVPVVDTPATIDVSRLVGLQTLINVKPVAPGSYTSATIPFGGDPTLEVLNTANGPPTVDSLKAVFSAMSKTVNFPQPLSLGQSQVMGLRLEFRRGKSIPAIRRATSSFRAGWSRSRPPSAKRSRRLAQRDGRSAWGSAWTGGGRTGDR